MNRRPELRRAVFTYEPTAEQLSALRARFPTIEMVLSGKDGLAASIPGAQLVVGGRMAPEAFEAADALAWVHVAFAGVESVLSPELIGRGVTITNSSGVSAPNMAEHVIAMMLALGRALPTFVRWQDRRLWKDRDNLPAFSELTGQTAVLLGTGAIGRQIARRLRGFDVRVVGARRSDTGGVAEGFDRIVPFAALPDVLPEADHVISSLPMTPATKRIVSAEVIARFKPGARFYNVGRGGTVDQDALIAALKSGHLAGAGLDVTDPEPLPEDSPLWDMPNVILTGHTSGSSPLAEARIFTLLEENIRRYMDGRELLNVVDVEWGY